MNSRICISINFSGDNDSDLPLPGHSGLATFVFSSRKEPSFDETTPCIPLCFRPPPEGSWVFRLAQMAPPLVFQLVVRRSRPWSQIFPSGWSAVSCGQARGDDVILEM